MGEQFRTRRQGVFYDEEKELQEAWDTQALPQVSRLCQCNWSDVTDFLEDMLGDVTTEQFDPVSVSLPGGGSLTRPELKIRREPPEPHPAYPWLIACAAEIVEGVGFPTKLEGKPFMDFATVSNSRQDGMARVRVHYRYLPYDTQVTDAEVRNSASLGELKRFVWRTAQPSAEAYQIGGGFRYVPPAVIPPGFPPNSFSGPVGFEASARVFPVSEMTYHFYNWPKLPPNIFSFMGLVNSSPFDSRSLLGIPFPAGTLLYLSPTIQDPFVYPSGSQYWNFQLHFAFRPTGWNALFKRSVNRFLEVSTDGAPYPEPAPARKHPYDSAEFLQLFTLI